jgi:hypothetical protein
MTVFAAPPDRIERIDVAVLQRTVGDELPQIQAAWPAFEAVVGLRGRKMYARVDTRADTYSVCTPVRDGDDPDQLGLELATLSGGRYLRGRLLGEPAQTYTLIGTGMTELQRSTPVDDSRALVEFYRRHGEIELWVPILEDC